MDEMTCLNLTISAPRDALGEKGRHYLSWFMCMEGASRKGQGISLLCMVS
jgi:hypothetical protein